MWSELAKQVHEDNVKKGFWPGGVENRSVGELLALIHSEITEAYTAALAGANDDKLPQYAGFDVEIADAAIRLLDASSAYGIDLETLPIENAPYLDPYSSMTDDLMEAHAYLSNALEGHRKGNKVVFGLSISQAFHCLRIIFAKWTDDEVIFPEIIGAKLAYNRSRPFMHGKKY
jgi:hypothetical protein